MVRRAFYSFHYNRDSWRAARVRNIGAIAKNRIASSNEWESIKRGGSKAIQKWIDYQLQNKSVLIVLIGSDTASRKWIKYEICKAWISGKGVLGVYIHNLEDHNRRQALKGKNPFDHFKIGTTPLSTIVKAYNPPYKSSKYVYRCIEYNLGNWIETAIRIRGKYN